MENKNTKIYSQPPDLITLLDNHTWVGKIYCWLNEYQKKEFIYNYVKWKNIISDEEISEEKKDFCASKLAEQEIKILMLEYEYLSLIKYKWICGCLLTMLPVFWALESDANLEDSVIFTSLIKTFTVSIIGFLIVIVFNNFNLTVVKEGNLDFYTYLSRMSWFNALITIAILIVLLVYLSGDADHLKFMFF